ncbi:zinc ribbon domain-containing protein [Rhodoferax sp. BLA1]|uniref:zinc ribbon domain-containing protein n=1 Tax=Rhodoferax sp. BLA1 TaxID=2576062 RepID=UPI0015D2CE5D|nr:zinc ribbon domain-containing protein [Rhodoferax sp. BLA1]
MSTTIPSGPRTSRGHRHAEAFCLMWYACQSCGHTEQFWNSRDGVTPFSTACPSCGKPDLFHVNFSRDKYAPKHVPHVGQRVWVSMTKDHAQAFAKKRFEALKAHRRVEPSEEESIYQAVFESIYRDGHEPNMVVTGYSWSQS